jgi:hypothetical protein
MNRERLELMVTLLAEVEAGTWEPSGTGLDPLPPGMQPTHRFVMVDWFDNTLPDCGFAACAVGHACLDARFNELGLFMQWDGPGQSPAPAYIHNGRQHRSWAAVGRFFDLTPVQEDYLFDGDKYPYDKKRDPAAVRQRIEQALAKKEPHP